MAFQQLDLILEVLEKVKVIYDDGEGELSDAASVLDWLQQYNTNSKNCWVAGFSFGCLGSNATINEKARN